MKSSRNKNVSKPGKERHLQPSDDPPTERLPKEHLNTVESCICGGLNNFTQGRES